MPRHKEHRFLSKYQLGFHRETLPCPHKTLRGRTRSHIIRNVNVTIGTTGTAITLETSRQISSLKPGPVYCDFVRAPNLTVLGASWHQNSREEGRKREEKVVHARRTMAGRCSWVRCNGELRKAEVEIQDEHNWLWANDEGRVCVLYTCYPCGWTSLFHPSSQVFVHPSKFNVLAKEPEGLLLHQGPLHTGARAVTMKLWEPKESVQRPSQHTSKFM